MGACLEARRLLDQIEKRRMGVIMKLNKIVWATLLLGLVPLVTACGA